MTFQNMGCDAQHDYGQVKSVWHCFSHVEQLYSRSYQWLRKHKIILGFISNKYNAAFARMH